MLTLRIRDGIILDYGSMNECPDLEGVTQHCLEGRVGFTRMVRLPHPPGLCRQSQRGVVDRIQGLSYAEIAAKGGGILNSASLLQNTPEDELYLQSAERLEEVISLGTTAIEIKSGYGLTEAAELKCKSYSTT